MNIETPLKQEIVVTEWLRYGFEDLMVAFFPLDKWHYYQPFFLAQAVEKFAKAYLLAKRPSDYENLNFLEGKKAIDKIARFYGHEIGKIINLLEKDIPQLKSIINLKYDGFIGLDIIKALDAGYVEARYPVPRAICEDFPLNEKHTIWKDPLASSSLLKFVFGFMLIVLDKIKLDYGIELKRQNLFYCYQNRIDQEDWQRFCNLFFKDSSYGI